MRARTSDDDTVQGSGPRLGTRLLIAQSLVLVAGALTAWLVASVVGPSIFHEHLRRAGVAHAAAEQAHVDEAFASALIIALVVALIASVLLALAVTFYFTRRVQRSTAAVAESASQIADGRYRSRVPSPGLGVEFDQLATTVNQLAERLEEVERTRRRMLADLAHEMRTPLATIEAHLEAVEDGVRELDDATLSVLRASTHRLGRLSHDVAAVSQAEEGGLETMLVPCRPDDLLRAATELAQDAFDVKGVELVLDTVPAPVVSADPERMAQILGNLLDNALRHTPRGGRVTLAVGRSYDKWVDLMVSDTGLGIEGEHLARVFDRFYRVDPARNRAHGGSGIGLTISRALVDAQHGSISARSAGPGHGATFTVRLPVLAGSARIVRESTGNVPWGGIVDTR